jgi:hypothetical protein
MRCKLFETKKYKPSKKELKSMYNQYKNNYFNDGDISDLLNVDVDYYDIKELETVKEKSKQEDDVCAVAGINDNELRKFMNGVKADCFIYIDDNIDLNEDVLKEILLHEMIHIYQISRYPEDYIKGEDHNQIFKAKAKEISSKANTIIRINIDPLTILSQEQLDSFYDEIKKESHIILIVNNGMDLNDFWAATIVPGLGERRRYGVKIESIYDKLLDYIKSYFGRDKYYEDVTVYLPEELSVQDVLKKVPSVLGRTKNEIYSNFLSLAEKISHDTLVPTIIEKESLPEEMVKMLKAALEKKFS